MAYDKLHLEIVRTTFSDGQVPTYASSASSWVASAGAGVGGLSNINLSAGTTSQNLSNFVLSNSNGLSFGLNGSTITASHNALTSQTVQTQGSVQVQGSTGAISFANSNGITFGGNNSTLTASHNGLTSQSNQALSGSNGSLAFQTATFGNLNGLSFYTSNGSMVGSYTVPSVPAQTNQTLGLYGVSNTTLSTSGTVDARTLSFQGAGGVSVGVSNGSVVISAGTGGGGGLSNINVSAGTTSQNLSNLVFNNGNNVTFGLNGSTVTASVAAPGGGGAPGISWWANYKDLGHVTRGVRAGATLWTARPIFIPAFIEGSGLQASRIRLHLERSAGVSLNMSFGAGLYSVVNTSSLSLMASTSHAISLTASTQWSGIRVLDITGLNTVTLVPGPLVIGLWFSGSGGSSAVQDFNFYGANRITPPNGFIFAGTNSSAATVSNSRLYPFHGAFRTTTAAFPANVATTDINHTGRVNQMIDIFGAGL